MKITVTYEIDAKSTAEFIKTIQSAIENQPFDMAEAMTETEKPL